MKTYFVHQGVEFTLTLRDDDDEPYAPPWVENDCHGVVSEWAQRDKRPSERTLSSDRGSHRFYDVRASIDKALKDWGCKTRADAAAAVNKDFEYLRAWCAGDWNYVGVVVTCTRTGEESSLWGVESDATEHHAEVARDLASDILAPRLKAWRDALRNARHARAQDRERFARVLQSFTRPCALHWD